MKYKWKLWLLPLVAVLAFGLYKGGDIWGQKKETSQDMPVQTVDVKEVAKVKKENVLSFTGSVEAVEETMISAKVAGRVSQVMVENSAPVTAGQPLVLLESQDYANALDISRAALKKAEVNLANINVNFQRSKTLYEGKAISKKDFEDAETGLNVAEADYNSAAAAVANAEESVRNTTITSPLNGLVADRNVNVGQVLSPGATLMSVKDISSVYVVVDVEQKNLASITPGQQAKVTIDTYGDRTFDGVVAIINPAAKEAARVFETKIKVNNPENLLKPGMFAKVEIKTGEAQEVLAVPQDALTSIQGVYYVFLADGDTVRRQQVDIGQLIGQQVEINSGLTIGQRVVVTNVNKLKDQDKIKIAA